MYHCCIYFMVLLHGYRVWSRAPRLFKFGTLKRWLLQGRYRWGYSTRWSLKFFYFSKIPAYLFSVYISGTPVSIMESLKLKFLFRLNNILKWVVTGSINDIWPLCQHDQWRFLASTEPDSCKKYGVSARWWIKYPL